MHDALFQEEVDHKNMKVKNNKQILHKTLNKVQKKDYNVERDAHPATPAGPLAYHYLYFFKAFLRGGNFYIYYKPNIPLYRQARDSDLKLLKLKWR